MKPDLPTGKWARALSTGRTAAKVGGKVLAYRVKRPFMSGESRTQAGAKVAEETAQSLFAGLSLLKGTALKMAQQLSLETDLLPEAVCAELAKAYHQVPPLNRALVRTVVRAGLGRSPDAAFSQFESDAFAAASLGQVHRAKIDARQWLAVKIQYPGIADTIASDLGLIRRLLGPIVKRDQLAPALDEVAARLQEEVDYHQEAENLQYFADHLNMDTVRVPQVLPALSSRTVLTTTLMPGKPLDEWLQDDPHPSDRDRVAGRLNDLFLRCFYELGVIHADPNPGNFIIADDLTIGLVDYGCVKRLRPDFIEGYRQLALAAAHNRSEAHYRWMIELGILPAKMDPSVVKKLEVFSEVAREWFGQLFAEEIFDFAARPGFIGEGQKVMRQFHSLRRHFRVNPDLIFLDRTRYGLLRIFEQLGARVAFRNPYEW